MTTNEPRWVTLEEASAASGVAVSTLRKWHTPDPETKRAKIRSKLDDGPTGKRRLVNLDQVLERSRSARVTPGKVLAEQIVQEHEAKQTEKATGTVEAVTGSLERSLAPLMAQLSSMSDRLEVAHRERADAEKRAEIAEFKLAQARAALGRRRWGRKGPREGE